MSKSCAVCGLKVHKGEGMIYRRRLIHRACFLVAKIQWHQRNGKEDARRSIYRIIFEVSQSMVPLQRYSIREIAKANKITWRTAKNVLDLFFFIGHSDKERKGKRTKYFRF